MGGQSCAGGSLTGRVPRAPAPARLAWWGTAWLRGRRSPTCVLDAVTDGDRRTSSTACRGTARCSRRPARATRPGAAGAGLALPVEGDPLGLGGPAASTPRPSRRARPSSSGRRARAGAGRRRRGRATGGVHAAAPRQLPDVGEADRALRPHCSSAPTPLADLDVARWRPEVADQLMNLRHRPALDAPAGRRRVASTSPAAGSRRWRSSTWRSRTTAVRCGLRDAGTSRRAAPWNVRPAGPWWRRARPRAGRRPDQPDGRSRARDRRAAGRRHSTPTRPGAGRARRGPRPHPRAPRRPGPRRRPARRPVWPGRRLRPHLRHPAPDHSHTSPFSLSMSDPPTIRGPRPGRSSSWLLTSRPGREDSSASSHRDPSQVHVSASAGGALSSTTWWPP